MVTTAMAQVLTTSIDVTKYYTLECKSTEAHSTNRFIGITDAGAIDGQSSVPAYVKFETFEDGYYIKVGEKYLNHSGTLITADATASTVWILGTVGNTVTFKLKGTTRYLNNVGADSSNGTVLNLKANNHPTGPTANNACSTWELREAVPGVVSGKVYRIINKANAGKAITENTDNFKLQILNKDEGSKAQLWLAEGNNITGYSFRNLKTADYASYVDETYTVWSTNSTPVNFFITKVNDATESSPNYYAITFNDESSLQGYAYMHYSNGNVVRWQAIDGTENIVNPTLWAFEEVSGYENYSVGEEFYNDYKIASENAQSLITESAFSSTAVTLTTDNLTCPAAITDGSDGGGVAALLDENNDTFMHTKYEGKGSYNEHHYIQVDLGDGNKAKYISFSYRARHNNQNNNPEKIIVRGSVDGETYTDIQTLTGLPDGLIDYNSKILCDGNEYRYFRFVVTETSNNAKNGDYVFFSLAKFRMNTYTVNDNYASKALVLGRLKKFIDENGNVDEKPDDWCLINGTLDELLALVHGATLRDYPFTLTTDVNAPVCYHLLSGRSNNENTYYYTLKPNENGKVKLETTSKNNVYSYWFFMEEPESGMLLLVPFIEETKPLGYIAVEDGDSKLTNNHSAAGFAGYYYELIEYAGVNGFPYALRPYGAKTNVSNHGGAANFMGFYDGAGDGGTAIKFEEVNSPTLEFRKLLSAIDAANRACPNNDRTGEMLNGYSTESVNSYKAVVAEAAALYETATTSAETIKGYLDRLPNLYEVLEINLPKPVGFYRIRCSDGNKRLLSTLVNKSESDTRLKLENSLPSEAIFYYDGSSLLSYTAGLYIDAYRLKDVGTTNTISFSKASNKVLGCYNISIDSRYIYGSGNYIDSGTNVDGRNGYNWWIEEVTKLPVTITDAKYATFYAPVEVTVPAGVEAYYITTDGVNSTYITLTKIEGGVVPANTGVLLKAEAGDYELEITSTDAAAISDNLLEGTVAATYVTEDAYVLSNQYGEVGLHKAAKNQLGNTAWKNNSHKAYLPASALTALQNTVAFYGFDWEGTTGIEQITDNREQSTVIYDLTGRRIEAITAPGIYVVNGKKVLVK